MLVESQVPLAPFSTLGVGGPAQYLVTATTEAEVVDALRWAHERELPVHVLGGGSNLVISDSGVRGLVLRIALRGLTRVRAGAGLCSFSVAAGEPWDDLVAQTVEANCQGLECLSGIPGLAGATPIQNVGAYGQEVSETIERVRVLDRHGLTVSELPAADCGFGYRDSLFKSRWPERYVVLGVTFRLREGAPAQLAYGELARHFDVPPRTAGPDTAPTDTAPATAAPSAGPSLRQVRAAVLELRKRKSMVLDASDPNRRSCGSFFVNALVHAEDVARVAAVAGAPPPAFPQPDGRLKVPSAWLIERAGLPRGTRLGPVGLSSRHTLALVAHDGATARDVLRFAHHVRQRVWERFGIRLVPEPDFWGFEETEARLPVLAAQAPLATP